MAPKQNTAALFIEAGHIIKNRMQKALPMPFSQCQTLGFIASEGRPNMQDVARYFKIRAPSATLLVDELVRGGYVARKAGSQDRRKVVLAATPKGKKTAKLIEERRAKVLAAMFGKLGTDDRRHLDRILQKVIKGD
jgi:DNA-binding MarR family transcriptional regulator